jgi:hypothetical protein
VNACDGCALGVDVLYEVGREQLCSECAVDLVGVDDFYRLAWEERESCE